MVSCIDMAVVMEKMRSKGNRKEGNGCGKREGQADLVGERKCGLHFFENHPSVVAPAVSICTFGLLHLRAFTMSFWPSRIDASGSSYQLPIQLRYHLACHNVMPMAAVCACHS